MARRPMAPAHRHMLRNHQTGSSLSAIFMPGQFAPQHQPDASESTTQVWLYEVDSERAGWGSVTRVGVDLVNRSPTPS